MNGKTTLVETLVYLIGVNKPLALNQKVLEAAMASADKAINYGIRVTNVPEKGMISFFSGNSN